MRTQWIWINLTIAAIGIGGLVEQASAEDKKPKFKLNVGGVDQPGGSIKGIVKFAGKQLRQKKNDVGADAFCSKAHKDQPLLKETYVWGKNNTLQNVFVYVSKGLGGKKFDPPAKKAVVDQFGCAYLPHVQGIMVGQELEIRSSDATLHNVKVVAKKNRSSNNGMPGGSKPISKKFSKPEMPVKLQCDVHNWMIAHLHVMEHPFFAVTQDDGTFEIKGLPDGKYEVAVWHEFKKFGPDKESVSVELKDGGTAQVKFMYSPKKKKKKKKKKK